ncbi:MAG: hypothetical protein ABI986_02400, partial [Chloroflexota bacterium]
GTGSWLGQFSLKWALAFFLFSLFCALSLIGLRSRLFTPDKLAGACKRLVALRERLGFTRWLFAFLSLGFPIYQLQYTYWGKVIHGSYLRILIALILTVLLGWLLTRELDKTLSWSGVLTALVLIFGAFVFFVPLGPVTSYPFSLGWSEGNRLWDYSIMFGHHLYDYPAGKSIPVYLDVGRQFIGGIPFLIPGIKIWQERLWLALIDVVPYLILGWIAYRLTKRNVLYGMLAGIWAFTFVEQGPIHPPLLLCAIIVAFAWGQPLWLAMPLVAGSGYFAEVSRFTWLFAPGIWAGMLELGSAVLQNNQLEGKTWWRAISLGFAGILGGLIAPFLGAVGSSGDAPVLVADSIFAQPLLWYRLLPNDTYGPGILLGLTYAVAPLIIILIYLAKTNHWILNAWQRLAILASLFAFLVVGLIVSVKIGGGGDLHNMDMFIIGLMFAGAIGWRNAGYKWINTLDAAPIWIRFVVVVLIIVPGYRSLLDLTPISISGDIKTVAILADVTPLYPLPDVFPDTLPSQSDIKESLAGIRAEVDRTRSMGDILFMDQRQLLTFGYIKGVPLVPEYDKKVLIDEALSSNVEYFQGFYKDLAAHRFSLIITSPLRENVQTSLDDFGEENNAWVKWVSTPLLCYYEPLYTLKKVHVQLLGPRQDTAGCDQKLPVTMQ